MSNSDASNRLSRLALFGLVLVLSSSVGCGNTPSPDHQVARFYGILESGSPADIRFLYNNLLSADTKAALDARAKRLSEVSGAPVQPWDVISFRGFMRGDRVSERNIVSQGDDEVQVEVKFEWFVPAVDETTRRDRPTPEAVKLTLRKEDGQWRIHLPQIASGPSLQ